MSDNILEKIITDFNTRLECGEIIFKKFEEATNIINTIETCVKNNDYNHIDDLIQDKIFDNKQKSALQDYVQINKNKPENTSILQTDDMVISNTLLVEKINSNSEALLLKLKNELIQIIKENKSDNQENVSNKTINTISDKLFSSLNNSYNSIIKVMNNNIDIANNESQKISTLFNQAHQEFYNKISELINQLSSNLIFKKVRTKYTLIIIFAIFSTNILTAFIAAKLSLKMTNNNFSNYKTTEQKAKNFDIIVQRLDSMTPKDNKFIKDKLGFVN